MRRCLRALRAAWLALVLALPVAVHAESLGAPFGAQYLRPEWAVVGTPAGGARVSGYLYNSNIMDAANVWLRVEQLTADGQVGAVYRRRVVGDVHSRGRLSFEVPVPAATASYRVLVESVDWVLECR